MSNISYGITALILQIKNQENFCPATRSDTNFSWRLEQCMCRPASSSASMYVFLDPQSSSLSVPASHRDQNRVWESDCDHLMLTRASLFYMWLTYTLFVIQKSRQSSHLVLNGTTKPATEFPKSKQLWGSLRNKFVREAGLYTTTFKNFFSPAN